MKLVINSCYGRFSLKKDIAEKYGFDRFDVERTDKTLIELVESKVNCGEYHCKLEVVEIPNETTDYYIIDYDGIEQVLYVVDGKIHFAPKMYA